MNAAAIADALTSGRRPSLLLILVSAASLAGALTAQFGFGMQPCHLCLLQRIPYGCAIVLAAIAAADGGDLRLRALLLGVCAAVFATNAGIAFYHVGVEQHWWESSCAGGAARLATDAGGLLAKLKQGPAAPACDMIPFSIFGLSFAGMNLIASLVLACFAAWSARRAWRAA